MVDTSKVNFMSAQASTLDGDPRQSIFKRIRKRIKIWKVSLVKQD